MRAITVRDRDAGVGGLTLTDMPYPLAAENEVIVRVHAAGFTPGELDWPGTWSDRAGRDRTPSIPGHELSGAVVELGYGTTGLSVGQRVFGLTDWTRNGSLAQYTAVEARNLAPLAADIDHTVAAAVLISGLAAWQGLFDHAHLTTGQTVLIHGGNAFVYAYVPEDAVHSQLEGEPMRTCHQGENWIEQPGAHHVATENASNTEPAELLVVFVVVALREFSKPASIARCRRHLIGAATAGALSNRTPPRRTRPADRQAARDELPVAYWVRKGSESRVSCRSLAGDGNWQDAPSRLALGVFALVLSGRPQLCPASGHRNGVSQKLIENSAIPYSIVHGTQFFEFVRRTADEATDGSTVRFAPVLFQPIAGDDVAQAVGKIAAGSPLNGKVEVAAPEQFRMDEFFRSDLAMRDDPRTVVTDPHASYVGTELGERTLLPGAGAILGEIRHSNWPGRIASGK